MKKQFAHHPPLLQGEQCNDFCVWRCRAIIPTELKNNFVNSKALLICPQVLTAWGNHYSAFLSRLGCSYDLNNLVMV